MPTTPSTPRPAASAALAVTAEANVIPGTATKPPGPPSGLSPLTVTTGGATMIIFRIVIVTEHSDH